MVGTLLWHQQPRCEIAGNAAAAEQGKEYEGQAHQRDVNAEVVGQPGAGAGQNATGEGRRSWRRGPVGGGMNGGGDGVNGGVDGESGSLGSMPTSIPVRRRPDGCLP